MTYVEQKYGFYITEDGNYGSDGVIYIFDTANFDVEQQMILSELSDSDRYDYVLSYLNGKDVSVFLN